MPAVADLDLIGLAGAQSVRPLRSTPRAIVWMEDEVRPVPGVLLWIEAGVAEPRLAGERDGAVRCRRPHHPRRGIGKGAEARLAVAQGGFGLLAQRNVAGHRAIARDAPGLVAQRERGPVHVDHAAGAQVHNLHLAFPQPVGAGSGNDGAAEQRQVRRRDVVSEMNVPEIRIVIQADHAAPSTVDVLQPPIRIGDADKVRAVFRKLDQLALFFLGLLAGRDIHRHADEARRFAVRPRYRAAKCGQPGNLAGVRADDAILETGFAWGSRRRVPPGRDCLGILGVQQCPPLFNADPPLGVRRKAAELEQRW